MMFWFNKQYLIQRTDYNIVVCLIIILGSQLPDSYFPVPPFTLSGFCTHSLWLFNSHCVRLLTDNPWTSIPLSFLSTTTHVFREHPWPGLRRPFLRNYSLERTDDALMDPTTPRLSRHCLWFDRYLRPFSPRYYIYITVEKDIRSVNMKPQFVYRWL